MDVVGVPPLPRPANHSITSTSSELFQSCANKFVSAEPMTVPEEPVLPGSHINNPSTPPTRASQTDGMELNTPVVAGMIVLFAIVE